VNVIQNTDTIAQHLLKPTKICNYLAILTLQLHELDRGNAGHLNHSAQRSPTAWIMAQPLPHKPKATPPTC